MSEAPDLIGDLTWDELVAGDDVRRLRRNKHFRGDVRAFQRIVTEQAAARGRVARSVRDDFRKKQYLWTQFVDFQIAVGEPCPRCGARELLRTQHQFGRCPTCHARLTFHGQVTSKGVNTVVVDEKLDRKLARLRAWRLDAFGDVRLTQDVEGSDETEELWFGRATSVEGEPVVLRLVYPLQDGRRQRDPEDPDEELYYLMAWPLEVYRRADALGALDGD